MTSVCGLMSLLQMHQSPVSQKMFLSTDTINVLVEVFAHWGPLRQFPAMSNLFLVQFSTKSAKFNENESNLFHNKRHLNILLLAR